MITVEANVSALWTFQPPFPDLYAAAQVRGIMLGAEPNGISDPFPERDMGAWFRQVPRSGTRYARAIMSYAEAIAGRQADPRHLTPAESLAGWRIGDLSPEEAGPAVEGDFASRVGRHVESVIQMILKDRPRVVVLLGVHCQREFEAQVAPVLRARGEGWVRRVGLPHPTLKTCGYFTLKELGPLDEKILPLDRPLQTFSPHRGW